MYNVVIMLRQQSRVQFRVTGDVTTVNDGDLDSGLAQTRVNIWRQLSMSARKQFGNDESTTPLPSFTVLMVHPLKVDVVDLRENERVLFTKQADGSWQQMKMAP